MVEEGRGDCDWEFNEGIAKDDNGEERERVRERDKESKLVTREVLKVELCELMVGITMRVGGMVIVVFWVFEIGHCIGRRGMVEYHLVQVIFVVILFLSFGGFL